MERKCDWWPVSHVPPVLRMYWGPVSPRLLLSPLGVSGANFQKCICVHFVLRADALGKPSSSRIRDKAEVEFSSDGA